MKNKGRRGITGNHNLKGHTSHLTRPVNSMASRGEMYGGKFNKSKWIKRIRGYFKSQTKEILC